MVSYLQGGTLYCFYTDGINYDDAIAEAHRKQGTRSGTVNVICKPRHKMDMVDRMAAEYLREKKR
jgi:hypothetical protein